mgnify:CR=1 FL=1
MKYYSRDDIVKLTGVNISSLKRFLNEGILKPGSVELGNRKFWTESEKEEVCAFIKNWTPYLSLRKPRKPRKKAE